MNTILSTDLDSLLVDVRACTLCRDSIPEPRPVLRAAASARILVVGQAPGTKVHASGIPWNDASGHRLRHWMGVDDATFYDESRIAIVPMGFCYPGKGRSGDLPPRPECAATWHDAIMSRLPDIRCTLLIGQYAQRHYLAAGYVSLTARVKDWRRFAPEVYVLPHPSPRNQFWLGNNPWFEQDTVPALRKTVAATLEQAWVRGRVP